MSFNPAIELSHTIALSDGDVVEYDSPGVFNNSVSISEYPEMAGANIVVIGAGVFNNSVSISEYPEMAGLNFSLPNPEQTFTLGAILKVYDLPPDPGDDGQILYIQREAPIIHTAKYYDPDAFRTGDIWINLLDNSGEVNMVNNDIRRDPTLESAIMIALFTDKRANEIDLLPDKSGDLRGWWADDIGSKLWLLRRSKITPDLPGQVEQWIKEALQPLIDDKAVKDFIIEVNIIEPNTLGINIVAEQPNIKQNQLFKYFFNWEAQKISKGRLI